MKKIMFSDKFGLTEAVLSGRKTQTRRIINPQPEVSERMGMVWKGYAYGITSPCGSPCFLKDVYHNFLSGTNYPQDRRYKVGEVVAVAQAYKDFGAYCIDSRPMTDKRYAKAEYMPHHIRITNVRVERLQDISDEDCIKEGVIESVVMGTNGSLSEYFVEGQKHICYGKTPREAYAVLIDRISGKGTWDKNPYVFVYDFELVD